MITGTMCVLTAAYGALAHALLRETCATFIGESVDGYLAKQILEALCAKKQFQVSYIPIGEDEAW